MLSTTVVYAEGLVCRQQLSKALGQGVAATILPTTAFEEKTEIAKPTMLSFLAKQQPVKAPKLAAFTEEADRPSSQPLSCKASQPVSVKGGTVRYLEDSLLDSLL